MATLTDAFLADLDALSDGDDQAPKEENVAKDEKAEDFIDIDSLKTDDIHAIASLSSAAKYQDTLQKVDEEVARNGDSLPEAWVGPSEADPVYRLIVACNELAMGIDDDIITTHTYIKQKYKKRFPELEGLVLDPLAYARVVERIGNEESVIDIDLEDIVPRTVQMTVSVSAATTDGQPLPTEDLKKVMEACKLAQTLDSDRAKLQRFVGSRMSLVAPNLSAVCGADVAAKLVGAAGGLLPLSTMPACNIQVLGQRKRINAGLSSANVGANQGFVFLCPMVTALPPAYRRKAAKLVANKVALLARFDAYGTSSARSGDEGQRMRDTMTKTIEKWMEPPPAAIIKPLAKPDAVSKKKRGGARYRRQKEKMAATEMMKQANRMEFGKAEEEYVDGDEMFGLGMLGKDGHGKLKVMQAASKITKREKLLQRAANGVTGGKGPGGAMSGTQSSLAFSHVQGIELENPNKDEEQMADVGGQRSGTESYFSELSGFKTFRKLT